MVLIYVCEGPSLANTLRDVAIRSRHSAMSIHPWRTPAGMQSSTFFHPHSQIERLAATCPDNGHNLQVLPYYQMNRSAQVTRDA
jgi:hypothetical protein